MKRSRTANETAKIDSPLEKRVASNISRALSEDISGQSTATTAESEAPSDIFSVSWPQPPQSASARGLRFLIFGYRGWIGTQLLNVLRRRGHHALLAESRADDRAGVLSELTRLKPDRVLCSIGRTHGPGCGTIDWLEVPGRLKHNVRDNLFAPVILALCCLSHGIHLTYIGTGCIYTYDPCKGKPQPAGAPNGADAALAAEVRGEGGCPASFGLDSDSIERDSLNDRGNTQKVFRNGSEKRSSDDTSVSHHKFARFTENDAPNFFGSAYSTVKGYTDGIMQTLSYLGIGLNRDEGNNGDAIGNEGTGLVLTARVRMPICGYHNSRDFITKLTKYERICSVPNSVTVLPSLLPVLIFLAECKIGGAVNFVNPGAISHDEVLGIYSVHRYCMERERKQHGGKEEEKEDDDDHPDEYLRHQGGKQGCTGTTQVKPSFRWRNFRDQEEMIACGAVKAARSDNFLCTNRLQRLVSQAMTQVDGNAHPSSFQLLSAREAVLRAVQTGGYAVPHPDTGK